MNAARLSRVSVAQLVGDFTKMAIAQGDDVMGGDTRNYNRLFDKMRAIEMELKSRPGDQRSALLPLLTHPELAVRWKASIATLAIAPLAARAALEGVVASKDMPMAGYAASTLRHFDEGVSKPD
jgi:hypothetical protein